MKLVKFDTSGLLGKTHILPKHSKFTLCGYAGNNKDLKEQKFSEAYPSCDFCIDSARDLMDKLGVVNAPAL